MPHKIHQIPDSSAVLKIEVRILFYILLEQHNFNQNDLFMNELHSLFCFKIKVHNCLNFNRKQTYFFTNAGNLYESSYSKINRYSTCLFIAARNNTEMFRVSEVGIFNHRSLSFVQLISTICNVANGIIIHYILVSTLLMCTLIDCCTGLIMESCCWRRNKCYRTHYPWIAAPPSVV